MRSASESGRAILPAAMDEADGEDFLSRRAVGARLTEAMIDSEMRAARPQLRNLREEQVYVMQ